MPDIFPTTHTTWLERTLVVDPPAARAHVMQRYFEPLCAYGAESSLPLRRWLANGLVMHLRERLRDGRIGGKPLEMRDPSDLETLDIPALHEPDAAMAMERCWAEAVVAGALNATLRGLETARRQAAWEVFQLHFVEGLQYETIATRTGRSMLDLKADAKLVQRRLRAEVEQALREDGVLESRLEEETDRLVAMLLGA